MAEPRDKKKPRPGDRTFRRLEEQDSPHAPPPVAWAFGLALGLLAGLVAMAADVAVLGRARIPVLPVLDLPSAAPWLVAHAALGAALGLLGGATGLFGPRWATAAVATLLGWLAAPWAIGLLVPLGVPAVATLGGCVLVAAALGQILGRIPVPAWVHAAASTTVFAACLVLVPLHQHLLPSSSSPGALVASLAVVALVAPIGALVAVFSRDGRPPVLSLFALGSLATGAAVTARPPPAAPPAPGPAGPTIVIVALDGVRAADVEQLPALARLSGRAVAFGAARSTSNWAVPALGSVLTGRLPYGHLAGLNDGLGPTGQPLDPRVPTLAQALRARGYATIGVTADPTLRAAGLDAGFQVWDDTPAGGAGPAAAAPLLAAGVLPELFPTEASVGLVTERAVAHLAGRGGTATLLLVHHAALRDGRGDVKAVDAALGTLFEAVPADAWLVVLGTHGRPGTDLRATVEDAASDSMFDERIHVPLAIRGPRVPPRRVDRVVTLPDVTATIAAIAKDGPTGPEVSAPDGALLAEVFGADPGTPERPVIAQSSGRGVEHQAIVAYPHKLVRASGQTALYDLEHDAPEVAPLRIDPTLDPLERTLEATLPSDGAPALHGQLPPLVVQLGQIADRALGSGR